MKVLELALRNLLRNRRRSLTTALAMTTGLAAVLLFAGYIHSISLQLQTDSVLRLGHLQLLHRDYVRVGSANPAVFSIAEPQRLIERLRADPVLAPLLVVATPVLRFSGIAGNFAAGVSRPVHIHGVVADEQARLLQWDGHGLAGPPRPAALAGTPADAAAVGTGVARVLQLCGALAVSPCPSLPSVPAATRAAAADIPADLAALAAPAQTASPGAAGPARIELVASDARGSPNVATVQVVRAQAQGAREVDETFIAMHLAQAGRLMFGAAPLRATAIVLQLHHTDQLPLARERLRSLLPELAPGQALAVHDYRELNPFLGQFTAVLGAVFVFVAVLIGSIVLFTVSNTMSMVVAERTVEIGTLRALGQRRNGIRTLFLCEGLLLGALGAAGAVLLALALAWFVNHSGLNWTPPGRAQAVPLAVAIAAPAAAIGALALLLVGTAAAVWPAARASRLRIVDALRHV